MLRSIFPFKLNPVKPEPKREFSHRAHGGHGAALSVDFLPVPFFIFCRVDFLPVPFFIFCREMARINRLTINNNMRR